MAGIRNIPELRFPEFEGEWSETQLSALLDFKNGVNVSKDQFGRGEKFINVLDILQNDFITHESIIGSVDIDKQTLEKYAVEYGDLVFQRSSESREEVGTASVYLDQEKKATFGGFVIRGKKIGDYYPSFLNLLMKTDAVRDSITSRSGGSTRYNVSQEILSSVEVNLPDPKEQKQIGDFITVIDQKIRALKNKKNQLELYKKGVTQKIFNQEIRFKDKDGKDFPEWEFKKGNEVFESISNKNHNSDLPVLAVTQEYGAIPRDEIAYFITVSDKSVEGYKVVGKGDFIISLRSFQGGIEYSSYVGICSPAYIILRPFIEVETELYKHYFKTTHYIRLLNKKLEGIRDGKMISYKYFSEISLPYPCIEEQKSIALFLSEIDSRINMLEQEVIAAEKWKRGLLQKMFC